MTRVRALLAMVLFGAAFAAAFVFAPGRALDPPMDYDTNGIVCLDCHTPHSGEGANLTQVEGNANVCLTCHNSTGLAAAKPFLDSDQALPGTSGTSHRFDSGPSGHAEAATSNTSTGTVVSGGTFTGRIERSYTLTITTGGNVGTARFSWTDTDSNSGTGVLTGTSIALASGITATFSNGTSPSFVVGDRWTIFVRTDLTLPSAADPDEVALALRLEGGTKVTCSTCHNQHSQANPPADTSAPAYTGPGTGQGRHYQRADNSANGMCLICHAARNVSSSSQGSHPIGITVSAGVPSTYFQAPAALNLIGGQVYCTTCHSPHYTDSGGANSGAGDGYLLDASIGTLCYQCHTLADSSTGSHFNTSTGALWPGGQYGSSFPANPAGRRGYCVNCHWPHGWPDDSDTAVDYPKLWVEQYDTSETGRTDPDDAEDLCFTCHDGSPATSNVRADIIKGTNTSTAIYHHPVKDSEQSAGRTVECISCHNPHRATSTDRHAYVAGVDINGTTITAGSRALQQYELCFKCHGDTYNSTRSMTSNKRTDFGTGNSAYHPVVQQGRNQSANLASQLSAAGLSTTSTIRCSDCHNSDSFSGTTGTITDSSSVTVGPHGSNYAPILRANLNRNYTASTGPSSYSSSNFTVCFRCHDETKLKTRNSGSATNFYDTINGKENLHWLHLEDRISKSRAVCQNCHYDIHSNQSSSNTQYRINGTLYTSAAAVSTARIKTHMVNFSPDILPYTDDGTARSKPEWYLDTTTRERRCYLSCHSYKMGGSSGSGGKKAQYKVASGDEATWTY